MTMMKKFLRLHLHIERWLQLAYLHARNLFSSAPITGDGAAVVNLTTYGRRTSFVHLAIESVALGAVRPRRLILWIDEDDVLEDPPRSLRRLARRGLEIRECRNLGPHKKYLPYLSSSSYEADLPFIIIDDDFLYPKNWLDTLLASYLEHPDAVSCMRAHEMSFGSGLLPYAQWPPCKSDQPRAQTFATGVGGVLYPPSLHQHIRSRGEDFLRYAPRADDVWLHYITVSSGHLVRQVNTESLNLEFRILPFAQDGALQTTNVGLGANDTQIQATYDCSTLDRLRLSD